MPRAVIDYLRNYPKSLRIFLEFLVEKKNDEESVHTQLAMMYTDDISGSDLNRNSPAHRMTINKLRSLLRTSQKLELKKLLEVLDTHCFPHEHAIVCGRLGQHSNAINTFIGLLQVINFFIDSKTLFKNSTLTRILMLQRNIVLALMIRKLGMLC